MRRVIATAGAAAVVLCACGSNGSPVRPATSSTSPVAPASSATVSTPETSAPRATATPASSAPVTSARPSKARFDHIVVVVLENHSYDDIVGASLPFLNRLAAGGLVLTSSYGVTHPSQPNYLALFSGSTQGLVDDSCPHTFDGPNLAAALRNAGYTFTGYSEGLPQPGSRTCLAGDYVRKHNPWVDFRTVPAAANQPLTSFPTDFTALPSVSFVIPDLAHDMHDGTPQQSDAWLRAHLESYAQWARTHDSLLVVTADEDDRLSANHIFTVFYGARVRAGRDDVRVDHYGVLRTLLDAFDLTPFGAAASAVAVPGIGTAG